MTTDRKALCAQLVESCLAQREEVLEAFIAKHGFCPDEAIQIEQRLEDGSSTWRIERRAALTQPEPEGATDEGLIQRLLLLAEQAVKEALDYDYGDPEDRYIWRELQELKQLAEKGRCS